MLAKISLAIPANCNSPLQCLQALEEPKRFILEAISLQHVPYPLLEHVILDLQLCGLLSRLEPMLSSQLHEGMLFFFDLGRRWAPIACVLRRFGLLLGFGGTAAL